MKVNVTSSKGLESNLNVVVSKKEIQDKIELRLEEVKGSINLKVLGQEKLLKSY